MHFIYRHRNNKRDIRLQDFPIQHADIAARDLVEREIDLHSATARDNGTYK